MSHRARLSCVFLLVAACSDRESAPPGGEPDLAVENRDGGSDLGGAPDFAACSATDPAGDGQACKSGCPMGTRAVNTRGGCTCLYRCDPAEPTQCSCNRRCIVLTLPDAGVVGGACFAGNGPAENCGSDPSGAPIYGHGGCGQQLFCAGDSATTDFCLYECTGAAQCPAQTVCAAVFNGANMQVGTACQPAPGPLAAGASCLPQTGQCQGGFLCDGTCKPRCDGPGAPCKSGVCTALVDAAHENRIPGYVCR